MLPGGVGLTHQTVWFLVALGLGILELMTGTFYLLMVALGFCAGGLVAMGGGSFPMQLGVAALAAGAATLGLRSSRFGKLASRGDARRNPDVNPDIGQRIQVTAWAPDGRARVSYRGAEWDVRLEAGQSALAGTYVITEVQGHCLILAAASGHQ